MNTINLRLYAILLLIFPCVLFLSVSCSDKKKIEKPNVIFIMADDLGYGDLGCYGQKLFQTPNIDKLAQEGMMFTQHYSGSTVCAPSRSVLMTGLHTAHTPIRGNRSYSEEGQYPLADTLMTVPKFFQQNGYVTGAFGKWGLGSPGSVGDPLNQGIDEFFGYNCQTLAHNYYPYHLWDNDQKVMLEENSGFNKEVYAPELIHKEALKFIEENRDQPFFLYVPSTIPHAELVAPEEEMKKFRGKYLPEKVYEGLDSGANYRQGPYESQTESHAAFVAMISILDRQVGEIVAKVRELGLTEKTIIIFTSDNGPHLEGGGDPDYFDSNGSLKGYKRDLYEGGIRVPMIISWPETIKKGEVSDHVSAFWDFFPTFAEMLDVYDLPKTDGISFFSEWLGKDSQKKHEHLYWEFHEGGTYYAIRKEKWKFVWDEKQDHAELYNLEDDPSETRDVSAQHADIVADMKVLVENSRTPSPVFEVD